MVSSTGDCSLPWIGTTTGTLLSITREGVKLVLWAPRPNNLSLVCGRKKIHVQIIKRKYIMTNINTQETDYSV